MRTRERMSGQAMVEFVISGLVVTLLVLAVASFGISAWQTSAVDYQLSTMAATLPEGWSSMDSGELVRQLILKDSTLDPARLTVTDAHVEVEERDQIKADDQVASELGSSATRNRERWLVVTGTVTYDSTGGVALGGQIVRTRTVRGSYQLERLYEIF